MGEVILNKSQEDKILQLLEEKEILYLTIEDKELEINYLKNKQMENFKLIQSIMDNNEKLQNSVLNLSKKIDMQNQEIGQLKNEVSVKTHRLRAFQIATAVTSTIILVKVFLM